MAWIAGPVPPDDTTSTINANACCDPASRPYAGGIKGASRRRAGGSIRAAGVLPPPEGRGPPAGAFGHARRGKRGGRPGPPATWATTPRSFSPRKTARGSPASSSATGALVDEDGLDVEVGSVKWIAPPTAGRGRIPRGHPCRQRGAKVLEQDWATCSFPPRWRGHQPFQTPTGDQGAAHHRGGERAGDGGGRGRSS